MAPKYVLISLRLRGNVFKVVNALEGQGTMSLGMNGKKVEMGTQDEKFWHDESSSMFPRGVRPSHHIRIKSADIIEPPNGESRRMIVVRYFLDRPGYGIHNSAARLWFHPPPQVTPNDLLLFLTQQGIALPGLLVEVFLDRFESFMLLEACSSCAVIWDFSEVTCNEPGILNVRLTDLEVVEHDGRMYAGEVKAAAATSHQPQYANVTPAGLFSFSMMVGLETVSIMPKLLPGSVSASYPLAWGPWMFFVGGVLQIIVGSFQVVRNNAYGATAFLGFGSFWFSNGLFAILRFYFASDGTLAYDLLSEPDDWGIFVRSLFVFGFSAALLKQTFVMNRLSTTLIALLCCKVFFQAFAIFTNVILWFQFVFGWLTSVFAFYVFLVELTNAIYKREVFPTYKWSTEHSPEEVFGAAGRPDTLYSKATRLRRASYPNVRRVRAATVDENTQKDD